MGETRVAKRILAFATAALLSGVAAPRVHARESVWLAVQGSTSLTMRKGESRSYQIRLKQPPKKLDRDGTPLDANDNPVSIEDAALDDGWWVRIVVDGAARTDGYYNADGDPETGQDDPDTPEKDGYDIRWVPSVGWDFDSHDGRGRKWDKWKTITVYALSDLDDPVVFTHEVWANSTYCPEHQVGRVTVSITDEGAAPPTRSTRPNRK